MKETAKKGGIVLQYRGECITNVERDHRETLLATHYFRNEYMMTVGDGHDVIDVNRK